MASTLRDSKNTSQKPCLLPANILHTVQITIDSLKGRCRFITTMKLRWCSDNHRACRGCGYHARNHLGRDDGSCDGRRNRGLLGDGGGSSRQGRSGDEAAARAGNLTRRNSGEVGWCRKGAILSLIQGSRGALNLYVFEAAKG